MKKHEPEVLEIFEGLILEVYEESFVARIIPTLAEADEGEAEFPKRLIYRDKKLIEAGNIFVLTMSMKRNGKVRAEFKFSDLIPYTEEELLVIEKKAKLMCESLGLSWK